MFDVAGLFLIMFVVAACAFAPLGYAIFVAATQKSQHKVVVVEEFKNVAKESVIPEDSVLRRHFLANLQAEIESAFAPRPTDSVLQRHHDALIAGEIDMRLAELAA